MSSDHNNNSFAITNFLRDAMQTSRSEVFAMYSCYSQNLTGYEEANWRNGSGGSFVHLFDTLSPSF